MITEHSAPWLTRSIQSCASCAAATSEITASESSSRSEPSRISITRSFGFIASPIATETFNCSADEACENGRPLNVTPESVIERPAIGNFVAFTDPYGSGGEKTAQMLKLTVEQPRTIQVEQIPGLTLPAMGSVLLAYSFTVWGYPVCGDPTGDVCDTDGQTNARINSLEQGQRRLEDGVNSIVNSLNNLTARLPAGR